MPQEFILLLRNHEATLRMGDILFQPSLNFFLYKGD